MTWQIFALISSLLMAAFIYMNHVLQMEGVVLAWVRSLLGVVIFVPVLFVVPLPTDGMFYALAVLATLLGLVADVMIYNTARVFGSRTTSIYLPIKIWVGFVLWAALTPSFMEKAFSNSLNLSITLLCFVLCSVATMLVRSNDFSRKAVPVLLLIGGMLAAGDVLAKMSMQPFVGIEITLVFLALVMLVNFVSTSSFLLATNPQAMRLVCEKKGMVIMLVSGFVFVGWLGTFVAALHLAPNPAYVTAATLLAVAWLMVYHKIRRIKEEGSPLAAIMFVMGAVGLLFFAP